MGRVSIEESTLTAIGDSIRAKTGKTDMISPLSMPAEIASIQGGGDAIIKTVSGACPITLEDCAEGNLLDYKIYGAEGGVGDKNKNLFNPYTLIKGYTTQWSDGTLVKNSNDSISDYINIEGASKVTATILTETTGAAAHPFTFYDADKNYIQISDKFGVYTNSTTGGQFSKTFTVPEGAKYCRFYILTNYSKGNTVWAQIEVGDTFTGYVPYGYEVPIKVNDDVYTIPSIYPQLGNGDYIDFENRKAVIGGVETLMKLPELPLVEGTNTLDVETTVKPSNVSLTYVKSSGAYNAGYEAMKLAVDMSNVDYEFRASDITTYPGNWYLMNLNFTDANGVEYTQIATYTQSSKVYIRYKPKVGSVFIAYNQADNVWADEAYRTIHITNGDMVTDMATCLWLLKSGQFIT